MTTTPPSPEGLRKIEVSEDLSKEGVKYDQGKPPMGLLPWPALREVAKVMSFGAQKYTRHNWLRGMDWSRMYDASLRHLTAWIDGEEVADDSNLNHLAHAACCILFLLTYQLLDIGTDDRWKGN